MSLLVAVSCSGKFHAFALSEQLEKHGRLAKLFTTYAYQKNGWMRRFAGRVDKENIPPEKISTALALAAGMKLKEAPQYWNDLFDHWVARRLPDTGRCKVFIGWSGMSLYSLRKAKQEGKITVLERGSAHIRYQDEILSEEYRKFGIRFSIDPHTVEKELKEYEEADFISIPSTFVKKSFLENGLPERKLFLNPYGASTWFKPVETDFPRGGFRVLYLGNLTIQKGLIYLFQALEQLNIPGIEAWFIGKVDEEMRQTVEKYARPNWKFFGFVNHYELPKYLSACDVGVIPSVQDGFGMVVPQMMSCGLPVIASTNTAAEDIIEDGNNGFIVPICSPQALAERLRQLHEDRDLLCRMKQRAAATGKGAFTWEQYGSRYVDFLNEITP